MKLQVRYGEVQDVLGSGVRGGAFTFVPALVRLEGSSFGFRWPLEPTLQRLRPEVLRDCPGEHSDAVWARARIEMVFGVSSIVAAARAEKSLMAFGFLASRDEGGTQVAIPFECTDHYGRSALLMADGVTDDEGAPIADAFWQMLLAGDALADYSDRAFHPGACVWINYGCTGGALYLDETDDDGDE